MVHDNRAPAHSAWLVAAFTLARSAGDLANEWGRIGGCGRWPSGRRTGCDLCREWRSAPDRDEEPMVLPPVSVLSAAQARSTRPPWRCHSGGSWRRMAPA